MKSKDLTNPRPRPLRRRPVLLLLLGAVALALVVWFSKPKTKTEPTAFFDVRRGDFTVSIVEGGTLTAVNELSIRNEVEGVSRIINIVREGTYVKKGDVLVELDSSQAQDQVNQQQINYEKAQFAQIQAEAQLKIQESASASDIRAAELKLEFARLDLKKFEEGQSQVDLLQASNKVVQAQAQMAVNLENYNWTTNLAAKGYETKQKVDVDRLAVLGNRNSLIVESNNMRMLEKFDLPKQRAKFESDVREAQNELERVKAQSERKLAQFVADLLTQSNTLALNLKKLERDRKNLDATRVKAPQDGLVVYPVGDSRFSSESLIEEGAQIRNRQEMIKLPDISKMKLTVRVHESHVSMVQAGQPAFVILDSKPDQRFQGYVDKVALLPDTMSRWGNPNLKVYNTDVVITDPLPGIKPGVSARAELIITNIANALSVPIQAVTTLKGRQVAYVQQGGRVAPVPVKVGLFNTKFIEVVSGLNEGDRVLLSPPFDTQEKDLEGGVLAAEERTQAARTNAARPRPPRATPDRIGRGSTNLAGLPDAPAALDPLAAADRQPEPGAGREGREGRGPRAGFNPEQMLKQYDKDGDGQLSDSERETMRADMAARFGQGRGPGMDREALLKQYDKDGDGELSESERETLRADMAARFGQGRGPGGSRTNRGDMFRRPDGPGGGEPDATGGGGRRGPRGGDRSRTNAPPRPEPENR